MGKRIDSYSLAKHSRKQECPRLFTVMLVVGSSITMFDYFIQGKLLSELNRIPQCLPSLGHLRQTDSHTVMFKTSVSINIDFIDIH